MLSLEQATQLADIALGHVTREYPNKLDHVLTSRADLAEPRVLHPIFHGSFDWHSCVHAYWLLAHLVHRYPNMPPGERIRAVFASAFTPVHVSAEVDFLARPFSGTFERPYGWAWLLMLAAELETGGTPEARQWSATLAPLVDQFVRRFLHYLPHVTYPTRSGVHSNTAFALVLALEYAQACHHPQLADAAATAARRWYLDDADCQAWEPSGEDFLSPCLIEAECMRRVLPQEDFVGWFNRFLPRLEHQQPAALFQPVRVSDRTDGRIAHLDGLNLSRSWCWRTLSSAVEQSDPRWSVLRNAAARHLDAALPYLSSHYMGEHWLATFACLALEAVE